LLVIYPTSPERELFLQIFEEFVAKVVDAD
jgi:hypothetical protein